jgi:hypothetical protein
MVTLWDHFVDCQIANLAFGSRTAFVQAGQSPPLPNTLGTSPRCNLRCSVAVVKYDSFRSPGCALRCAQVRNPNWIFSFLVGAEFLKGCEINWGG